MPKLDKKRTAESNILKLLETFPSGIEFQALLDCYRQSYGSMSVGGLSYLLNCLARSGRINKRQISRNATGIRQIDFIAGQYDESGLQVMLSLKEPPCTT